MRGEEERIAESRPPAAGWLHAAKGMRVLVLCAAAGTIDAVRGNRGTLLLPVACRGC
jgi:hypothetical protein